VLHFPSFVFLSLYLSLCFTFRFNVRSQVDGYTVQLFVWSFASPVWTCIGMSPSRAIWKVTVKCVLAYSDLHFCSLPLHASGSIHPARCEFRRRSCCESETLYTQQCVSSGLSDLTQTKKHTHTSSFSAKARISALVLTVLVWYSVQIWFA
jgi:hypothetical protein